MRPKIYVIYDAPQISPSSDKLTGQKAGVPFQAGTEIFLFTTTPIPDVGHAHLCDVSILFCFARMHLFTARF